jgi:glycosyltransferase involved in cell wall biosynthesis
MTVECEAAVQVSCILPAFNEGPRIANVLRAVLAHPLIDEVIVVDDGSGDDTAAVAAGFPQVRLIRLAQNGGKTRAMGVGIAQARGRHVLFIDSDLGGLGEAALSALILPVLQGRADVAISLRHNAPAPWHWIGLDYISGERMLRRDLLANRLGELQALPRFGFEVWMNAVFVQQKARLAIVPWDQVDSPLKSKKFGLRAGIGADIRMMNDLFKTASPLRLLHQIWALNRQIVVGPRLGDPLALRIKHRAAILFQQRTTWPLTQQIQHPFRRAAQRYAHWRGHDGAIDKDGVL